MGRAQGNQRISPRDGRRDERARNNRPRGQNWETTCRSSVPGSTLLLIAVLPACTLFHGSATDNPTVDLELTWDGTSCKAAVQDPIYVATDGARITWNVTDNCNQTEKENETQFVFKYQSLAPWLDAEDPVVRTKKNGTGKADQEFTRRGSGAAG